MDYSKLTYELLAEYLPQINDFLSDITSLVTVSSSELVDISKFLLWFLVAFLSTKILKWRYRV